MLLVTIVTSFSSFTPLTLAHKSSKAPSNRSCPQRRNALRALGAKFPYFRNKPASAKIHCKLFYIPNKLQLTALKHHVKYTRHPATSFLCRRRIEGVRNQLPLSSYSSATPSIILRNRTCQRRFENKELYWLGLIA